MESPRPPGIVRDLQQIQSGSSATAAELREFLKQMKGRSPQEVLGMIAQSSLVQSTAIAALGCVVLLAVGTLWPWYVSRKTGPATAATAPAVNPASPAKAKSEAASPVTNTPGATSQPAVVQDDGIPKDPTAESPRKAALEEDILNRLGAGDTKTADPDVNPLDRDDDLLKGAK